MRNVLARVPRANAEMIAAAIRTIFAQPDSGAVAEQFDRILAMLQGQFPDVASILTDAREDLLAFAPFRSSTGTSCGPPTLSNGSTGK